MYALVWKHSQEQVPVSATYMRGELYTYIYRSFESKEETQKIIVNLPSRAANERSGPFSGVKKKRCGI